MWDTIKPIDIGIMGVPEEDRRGAEWIFEEVMTKNKDTSYSNCQKPKTESWKQQREATYHMKGRNPQ